MLAPTKAAKYLGLRSYWQFRRIQHLIPFVRQGPKGWHYAFQERYRSGTVPPEPKRGYFD
jgi:hypothetical protein